MKLPTDTNGLIFPYARGWWHSWYCQRAKTTLRDAADAVHPHWRRFWLRQARQAGAEARQELDQLRRG